MATIRDFDKINKKVARAFKVNRRVLANESLKYHLSVPSSCLKSISQVNSLPGANKLSGVQQLKTFGSSETMSELSDIIKVSNRAAQKLGKWIVDNPNYFTAPSLDVKPDIKSSVFLPADMELCNPNAGTNKRLDKLNDNSEKTAELLQLMVDVARSTSELNQQMASTLDVLSHRQEETNSLAINHHSEDVKSAKKWNLLRIGSTSFSSAPRSLPPSMVFSISHPRMCSASTWIRSAMQSIALHILIMWFAFRR